MKGRVIARLRWHLLTQLLSCTHAGPINGALRDTYITSCVTSGIKSEHVFTLTSENSNRLHISTCGCEPHIQAWVGVTSVLRVRCPRRDRGVVRAGVFWGHGQRALLGLPQIYTITREVGMVVYCVLVRSRRGEGLQGGRAQGVDVGDDRGAASGVTIANSTPRGRRVD